MSTYKAEFLSCCVPGKVEVMARKDFSHAFEINACDEELVKSECILFAPFRYEISNDGRARLYECAMKFDRHGVVFPYAGVRLTDSDDAIGSLPETSIFLLPLHDCVLVRSDIFRRFGGFELFDEFSYAIAEFAVRVNRYGFSCVQANQVLIPSDAVSFLDQNSFKKALGRDYPEVLGKEVLQENLWRVEFAKALSVTLRNKPKVLFEYSNMVPWYCGTSEMQLAVLDYFLKFCSEKYEIVVRCNHEATFFHGLADRPCLLLCSDSCEEELLFDIGFVSAQPLDMEQQLYLNDHCMRIVYTMLDCILLRSGYLAAEEPSRADVVRGGLRYADGVIAISDFSRADYLDFFECDKAIVAKLNRVVYLSSDSGSQDEPALAEPLPFESYVLVAGSKFKHKALVEFLSVAKESKRNFVIVGFDELVAEAPNIKCYRGGLVDDEFLSALYSNCDCLVFPSQYEGFGLPITIAWRHGKKVVACDNDLNRELADHFSNMRDNIAFFMTFDEIEATIGNLLESPFSGSFEMSWSSAAAEIEEFIGYVLSRVVDWPLVDERQWFCRMIREARRVGEDSVGFNQLLEKRYKGKHSVMYKVISWILHISRSFVDFVRRACV